LFLVFAAAAALTLIKPDAAPVSPDNSSQYVGVGFDYFLPSFATATEHSTTGEAVVASNGTTNVVVYQVGRYFEDGAAAVQYSTQYRGGHFALGFINGLTKLTNTPGPYDRITYESIAYNARFNQFLVALVPLSNNPDSVGDPDTTLPPVVVASVDGIHWSNPSVVSSSTAAGIRPEKSWIVCDNNRASPYYGRTYVVWDDNIAADAFHAAYSNDAGHTWTASQTAGQAVFGALPVVQPNGNVVSVSENVDGYDSVPETINSTFTNNGGQTWSSAFEVSAITSHTVAGQMRTQPLPTSAVDQYGNVYAVWQDCRFESGCSANDLVLSTSRDGMSWTAPVRLPLKKVGDSNDLFMPSLAIESTSRGPVFGLEYYEAYPLGCSPTTCSVVPMFVESNSSGQSVIGPIPLTQPMPPVWLATTSAGYMLGDYFQATFCGNAFQGPVALGLNPAIAPVKGDSLYEAIVVPYFEGKGGLARSHPTAASHGGSASKALLAAFSGGQARVYRPARLAPKVKMPRYVRHPM
jgi:hypothetical protein